MTDQVRTSQSAGGAAKTEDAEEEEAVYLDGVRRTMSAGAAVVGATAGAAVGVGIGAAAGAAAGALVGSADAMAGLEEKEE